MFVTGANESKNELYIYALMMLLVDTAIKQLMVQETMGEIEAGFINQPHYV